MKLIISFVSGIIFAFGLGISGMTQPQKIIGFLDFFGKWDPSLIFVMIGAIGVHSLAYHFLMKTKGPLLEKKYTIPNKTAITKSLIGGSLLFGIGWGLAGFCPGPGIVSLFSGNIASVNFVISMLIGIYIFRILGKRYNIDG